MSKILTLGEIMLRLSTDPGTLMTYSTNFTGHYGGGEANVGISLANFGHEVAFASKVPANPLGGCGPETSEELRNLYCFAEKGRRTPRHLLFGKWRGGTCRFGGL